MSSHKTDQWYPKALNFDDLQTFTTTPKRVSKLSDDAINALLGGAGGIRWVTAGSKSTFYRMTSTPWYSDHGTKNSCNYDKKFFDAYSAPATEPTWSNLGRSACGGAWVQTSGFLTLSGIHITSDKHKGAFNGAWEQNGYVYVRSTGVWTLHLTVSHLFEYF